MTTSISSPIKLAFKIAAPLVLVLFFGIGFYLRVNQMLTVSDVLLYQREYDEGVYVASAQLFLQGYVPYRDFMFVEPPLSLYLYAAVLSTHPVNWGDPITFQLARYTTIAFGLITLVAVAIFAKRLGGWTSALFSVGLLAADAIVIEIDRRVMLEPVVNALSALALISYLQALNRKRNWVWLFSAGLLGILAALLKTAGVIALGVILVYAVWRIFTADWTRVLDDARKSRIRELLVIMAGAGVGIALVTGYFMITNPIQFLRQVYLFHFLRPVDGVLNVTDRFNEILSNPGSQLTIYMAAGGLAIILLRGIVQHDWGEWGLMIIWIGGMLGLIVFARTFYLHYFVQALVPLAIVAGALVSQPKTLDPNRNRYDRRHALLLVAQGMVFIYLVITNLAAGITQYETAQDVPNLRSQIDLRPIRRFLAANTPADAHVLGFEPIFALTASRKPAGTKDNDYLVDSYGYMLYENMGLDTNWIPPTNDRDVLQVMHGERGQEQIVGVAKRADYIVIDDRARRQLTLESLSKILQRRLQVFETGQVVIYGPAVAEP